MAVAGLDTSRVRLSPTRSVRSWATPPTTPSAAYTPLIQVDWHGGPPSANSSPGSARDSSWYTPQLPTRLSRTGTHSRSFTYHRPAHSAANRSSHGPAASGCLQIPLDLHGKHSQKRGSADSLVEAVSNSAKCFGSTHMPLNESIKHADKMMNHRMKISESQCFPGQQLLPNINGN